MSDYVVVGIDPSLTATGIATPDGGVHTVRSSGHDGDTVHQRSTRLRSLTDQITAIVATARPDDRRLLVVIERQADRSITGHQHDRSGLWWLLVDEFLSWPGCEVAEVTGSQRMKYATGTGRAEKDEVLAAVIRRYPDVLVSNNDEADALVFRAMGCDYLGAPIVPVRQTYRDALTKVPWPIAPPEVQ